MITIRNQFNGSTIAMGGEGESQRAVVERVVKDQPLRDANLSDANLSRANLSNANLSRANLINADLTRANLINANLSNANLNAKQYVARIQGRRHEINVINDDVRIGCIRMGLADWMEQYEAIGREQGYTPFEVAEYGAHLQHIAEVRKLWAAAKENTEVVHG